MSRLDTHLSSHYAIMFAMNQALAGQFILKAEGGKIFFWSDGVGRWIEFPPTKTTYRQEVGLEVLLKMSQAENRSADIAHVVWDASGDLGPVRYTGLERK